jgi:hypothetical protein
MTARFKDTETNFKDTETEYFIIKLIKLNITHIF